MRRITLWLFIIALVIRLAAFTQHVFFGIQGIPFLPSATPWADFDVIYTWQLSMLQKGFVLYRDIPYSYPPLFIYTLYPFFLAAGKYAAAVPIVVADAASAPVIYLIAVQTFSRRVATATGVAYALSPLAIFNEGYLWMSSQPMTLFVLLSVYFASRRQAVNSMITLALAVLFKQEALAVLPAVTLFLAKYTGKSVWKSVGVFVCVLAAASVPFIILAPLQYASSVSFLSLGAPGPTLVPNYVSSHTLSAQSCTNVFVNKAFPIVAVCGNANPDTNQFIYLEVTSEMQRLAQIVAPILLVSAFPVLIVLRERKDILQSACAYSTMGLILVFSALIHQSLDYYLVPVYAFLFASSSRVLAVAISLACVVLILLSPGGSINTLITVGCIVTTMALQDKKPD
jgi:hypothetical protein